MLTLPDNEKGEVSRLGECMGLFIRPTRERTKAVATHVKNIPRAEREDNEEAVRDLLPKERILNVTFIGNSVMEILTEKHCFLNLVQPTHMKIMPNLNVFENALSKTSGARTDYPETTSVKIIFQSNLFILRKDWKIKISQTVHFAGTSLFKQVISKFPYFPIRVLF